ncbi:MAG: PaaI family thioesterase [Rhodocyclaceae bacterium]|nr:PaaI family thioesterase [Rhodocyclaceae bacterium]
MSGDSKGLRPEVTQQILNERGTGFLPGLLGIEVLALTPGKLFGRMAVQPHHLAPNGYMHAASVVALADTTCGYGTIAHLPQGAASFTTIELKSNFLGTVREGAIACEASAEHLGRNTHVWDAVVTDEATGKKLALFRCTQMILWPKAT